jgi:sugar phosphate isomerase/epimerase
MSQRKVGASTFCLLNQPVRQAVESLLDLGFAAIELFGDAPQAHYTQLNTGDRRYLRAAGARCELSLHAPVYEVNLASANPCSQEEAVRQYREAVYLAAEIGATRLVVHEGHTSYWKLDRQVALQTARRGLGEVLALSRQVGVTIALENTNFGKFAMYEAWQEWADLAASLALPTDAGFRLALDLGHARLAGWDFQGLIRGLAPRIAQVHVHDTSGAADDHLAPGDGVVDWAGIRQALADSGCAASLILEHGPVESAEELRATKAWLDRWSAA